VCGVYDNAVRRKLLQESKLVLEKINVLTFVMPPKSHLHNSKKWRQTNNNNIPVKSIWSPKDMRGNQKALKITSWMSASFVVVNRSREEESTLRMVKHVRRVENLIDLPWNVKAEPTILKGPLKNPKGLSARWQSWHQLFVRRRNTVSICKKCC